MFECIVIACALLQQPQPTPEQEQFAADWKRATAVYGPIKGKSAELLKAGKLAESTKALLDAVPKDKRTAAHAFMLATTLFDIEPQQSFALHEEAFAKAPDMLPIQLEWAIELQRAGKWAQAEPLYKTLLDAAKPNDVSVVAALRSECLLRLGRIKDAVDCWSKVNVEKDDIQIEKAACWIHNGRSPEALRCELIAKVDAGDADAADLLILLDLDFARDWWNGGVNERYLDIDLARVTAKAVADPWRTKQTVLLAELMRVRSDPTSDAADAALTDVDAKLAGAKIVGDDAILPANSRVVSYWFDLLMELGGAEAPELLAQHEAELKTRAKGGDTDALEVLEALYAATDDSKLAAVDREGFERFGDPRFAGSLLASKATTLKSDDPDLKRAIELNGTDPRITHFAVMTADREHKPMKDVLARHVAAMFTCVFQTSELDQAFKMLRDECKGS